MQSETKVAIFLFTLSGILLISALVFAQARATSLNPVEQIQTCTSLKYSSENAINLVFLGNKEESQQYSDYLFDKAPFKNHEKAFNVYYRESFVPDCKLYKGIAIFCHSSDLIRAASACPNDYIIVLEKTDPEIRSSSYSNVVSINTAHPRSVLLHELGHAFANFAEEYINNQNPPRDSENCAASCDLFGDECYEGCSQTTLMRSIDEGVMRTLNTEEYGSFNSQIIEDRIKTFTAAPITGNQIVEINPDCSDQKYYLIQALRSSRGLQLQDASLEHGCAPQFSSGEAQYSLTDSQGTLLREAPISYQTIFTDIQPQGAPHLQGELFESNEVIVAIPTLESATEVTLRDEKDSLTVNLEYVGETLCQ